MADAGRRVGGCDAHGVGQAEHVDHVHARPCRDRAPRNLSMMHSAAGRKPSTKASVRPCRVVAGKDRSATGRHP